MNKTLILSGGADYGAFQCGVLKHLILNENYEYKEMYGVSVGALNIAFLSQFSDLKEGVIELEKFWLNIKKENIYKHWFPFSYLHGLWQLSLYNSQPLINLVKKNINLDKINSNNRKIGVGCVSLKTGKFKIFENNHPQFLDAVLASSSFPIAFKPIEIEGELYNDGGIKNVIPVSEVVKRNNSADLIITYEKDRKYNKNNKNKCVIDVIRNSIFYMRQEIEDSDITMTKLYNELIKSNLCIDKKYIDVNIYYPEEELSGSSLDFNHNDIVKQIKLGYETAKKQYY